MRSTRANVPKYFGIVALYVAYVVMTILFGNVAAVVANEISAQLVVFISPDATFDQII
jgi:hypothetical protein